MQGGKDNYEIDRSTGDAYAAEYPQIFDVAKETRMFLSRAVRYMAGEEKVRQFLDIGCGLPVPPGLDNIHEVAQGIRADARVVYMDSDKVVMSHARALFAPIATEGVCAYYEADVHDPAAILSQAASTLDFTEPIAVILSGVLGHVPDLGAATMIMANIMSGVPSGSFLIFADGFDNGAGVGQGVESRNETGIDPYTLRTIEALGRFFAGLELAEPGIVPVPQWRPPIATLAPQVDIAQACGVARKP